MTATSSPARISRWEWIAAAIGTALVVSMIVVLLMKGRREQTPPRLAIAVEQIDRAGSSFRVAFVLRNDGGSTASDVIVRGELQGGGTREESEVSFQYVPDGSERRGALLFTTDPRAGRLSLRPLGYREP
jgi:uncharacterized protein (TIGR02588 family)